MSEPAHPPHRPSHRPSHRPIDPSAPKPQPWSNLSHDFPASIVVFLVALPLCLGIAHGSGAPLLAGIIAGVVGGMLVSWLSGAQLGVSGPAAGLTTIVLGALDEGSEHYLGYEGFLLAVVLAGVFQLGFAALQAGIIAYYFPSNVIKGLLAAIGVLIILKQLPHALGLDSDWMGDEELFQEDGLNTFSELFVAFINLRVGALIVAGAGLAVIVLMDNVPQIKKIRLFKLVPAPLFAVLLGLGLNLLFSHVMPSWVIEGDDLVRLPSGGPVALLGELTLPDFGRITDLHVWQLAITLALVASLETLLCVEAVDKLDPYKRTTPTNRELMAQGIGNMVSGMLGGLPMTAVIVRGSANIQAGGRTHMSAFLHGLWLLLSVLAFASVLNMIPLASLAAVLLVVGYKLTRATLWKQMWSLGLGQFVPFAVTVVAILATDLLKGVGVGLVVSVFTILRENFKTPYFIHHRERSDEEGFAPVVRIELSENVSFLNKAAVRMALEELPNGVTVEIDGKRSTFIDRDVLEIIEDFKQEAKLRDIEVVTENLPSFVKTDGH